MSQLTHKKRFLQSTKPEKFLFPYNYSYQPGTSLFNSFKSMWCALNMVKFLIKGLKKSYESHIPTLLNIGKLLYSYLELLIHMTVIYIKNYSIRSVMK